MSKVFVSVTMSLDGFLAPESRGDDTGDRRWMAQWLELQKYVLEQQFFRENLKLGPGGQTGEDNRFLKETFERTGVTVIGKRMFDAGERMWPEEAPFHTPVFVLTRQKREPWVRKGGTTFHFVNDGIESALHRAREVANGRDIRIGGGAHTIREYLEAGLVDELQIALAPVLFGRGISLFDRLDTSKFSLEHVPGPSSPMVAHLSYLVRRK
jgi:dihydrofolate reductase